MTHSHVEIELPWPPSVNTYWRRNGHIYFISAKGKQYRKDIYGIVQERGVAHRFTERLSVDVLASPPDRRKRDLDNILKSLFDSLTHAGVYEDDSQIDQIRIARLPDFIGRVYVTIVPIQTQTGG